MCCPKLEMYSTNYSEHWNLQNPVYSSHIGRDSSEIKLFNDFKPFSECSLPVNESRKGIKKDWLLHEKKRNGGLILPHLCLITRVMFSLVHVAPCARARHWLPALARALLLTSSYAWRKNRRFHGRRRHLGGGATRQNLQWMYGKNRHFDAR